MTTRKFNRRDFLKVALASISAFAAVEIGARLVDSKRTSSTISPSPSPSSTPTLKPTVVPSSTATPTSTPSSTTTATPAATATPAPIRGVTLEQGIRGTRIPIVEYHYPGYSAGGVAEPEELVLAQLDFFQENGFKTVDIPGLSDFLEGKGALPAKSFVLRIDQGAAHFAEFEKLLNWLMDRNFTPQVYVISGDAYSEEQWSKFAAWQKEGWISLGSHSASHPNFDLLTREASFAEAYNSKLGIQNRLAQRGVDMEVIGFAFPSDIVPAKIDFLKSAGYKFGLGGSLYSVRENSALPGQFILPSLYPYVMQSLLKVIQANDTNNLRALDLTCGYPLDTMIYWNTTPITRAGIETLLGEPYPEVRFGEIQELPISSDQKRSLVRPVGIIVHTDDQGGNYYEFWRTSITYDSLKNSSTDAHFAVDRYGVAQFLTMYPDFCTPSRGARGFSDYISIEMCGRDYNQVLDPNANAEKKAVIRDTTQNAIALIKTLLAQYRLDPARVLGHYQASAHGKTDPGKTYWEGYFLPQLRSALE